MKRLSPLWLLAACVLSLHCASGRPTATASAAPGNPLALAFDHQALQVTDLAASAAFYTDVLGLTERGDAAGARTIRWFQLGDGREIHLIELAEPHVAAKQTHLALAVRDLDAFAAHLRERGVGYGSWVGTEGEIGVREDGVRQIYVQDPDGHWIEINSPPSGSGPR